MGSYTHTRARSDTHLRELGGQLVLCSVELLHELRGEEPREHRHLPLEHALLEVQILPRDLHLVDVLEDRLRGLEHGEGWRRPAHGRERHMDTRLPGVDWDGRAPCLRMPSRWPLGDRGHRGRMRGAVRLLHARTPLGVATATAADSVARARMALVRVAAFEIRLVLVEAVLAEDGLGLGGRHNAESGG